MIIGYIDCLNVAYGWVGYATVPARIGITTGGAGGELKLPYHSQTHS